MNQSIIIEVDKTTENILNIIEERISTGSMDAMEQVKDDIVQELENSVNRIRMKLEDSTKKVLKTNEELREEIKTTETAVVLQLKDVYQMQEKLKQSIIETNQSIEKRLDADLRQIERNIKDDLENNLKQTKHEIGEQLCLLISSVENNHKNIDDSLKEVQKELNNKTHENQQLIELINQLTNKLEKIEAEVVWGNQPFYKKWFSKGRE